MSRKTIPTAGSKSYANIKINTDAKRSSAPATSSPMLNSAVTLKSGQPSFIEQIRAKNVLKLRQLDRINFKVGNYR